MIMSFVTQEHFKHAMSLCFSLAMLWHSCFGCVFFWDKKVSVFLLHILCQKSPVKIISFLSCSKMKPREKDNIERGGDIFSCHCWNWNKVSCKQTKWVCKLVGELIYKPFCYGLASIHEKIVLIYLEVWISHVLVGKISSIVEDMEWRNFKMQQCSQK